MTARRRWSGFTLIEVLVALTLVAAALGGTLVVVREAIRTQQYLERRLFAQWVADNVINQFILETRSGIEVERAGREVMLGRTYTYLVSVTPLAPASSDASADPAQAGVAEVDAKLDPEPGPDMDPTAAKVLYEVAVEVRDGGARTNALARIARQTTLDSGV